jgi:hypothetical protein
VPQTFTESAAQDDILVQIQPEALIFLQDREMANHIMATLLTFQHRHPQILNAAPARLQAASIMPIAREVLRIRTATLPTYPINHSWLFADMTYRSRLSSQLGAHLCFQEHFYHGFDRRASCGFGLLVDFFQNGLSLVFFQFPWRKVYSHTTDPSRWLSLLFFFTLPL